MKIRIKLNYKPTSTPKGKTQCNERDYSGLENGQEKIRKKRKGTGSNEATDGLSFGDKKRRFCKYWRLSLMKGEK